MRQLCEHEVPAAFFVSAFGHNFHDGQNYYEKPKWIFFYYEKPKPGDVRPPFFCIDNTISTSIVERLGSVLGGQDGSQIQQKSIDVEFPRPSVSASLLTSIFYRFLLPTSTPWISKKYVFPVGKTMISLKPAFRR